jgi:hypothetical protein
MKIVTTFQNMNSHAYSFKVNVVDRFYTIL